MYRRRIGEPGMRLKNVVTELRIEDRNARRGRRGAGISVGDEAVGTATTTTGTTVDMMKSRDKMKDG